MRSYPVNSPQAAGRIIALTVLADGDTGDAEIRLLDRLAAHEQIGLSRDGLHALLDSFCEELLLSGQLKWAEVCPVDERTLAALMGEIEDPAMRLRLLRLCVQIAEADEQVDAGESIVLAAAVEHWGLQYAMFQTSRAL